MSDSDDSIRRSPNSIDAHSKRAPSGQTLSDIRGSISFKKTYTDEQWQEIEIQRTKLRERLFQED